MRRFLPLLLLLAGCKGPPESVVSGTVTLDGQPLAEGHVTFYPPEGGTADTVGAPVVNGRYELKAAPPGPRIAVVAAAPGMTAKAAPNGVPVLAYTPGAPRIGPAATGHRKEVEIAGGSQTLDFDIRNR